MRPRICHVVAFFLALLSIIAGVLWLTSYRHPFVRFIDLVGSIKRQREIQEQFRTRGWAERQAWYGPIGVVEVYDGTLRLRYDGREFMGSIMAPSGHSSTTKKITMIDLSLFVTEFHFSGTSEWADPHWSCDLSLWFLAVALGLYPGILLSKFLYRGPRNESELCVKCGYNLFGLPVPRCPECGKEFADPS